MLAQALDSARRCKVDRAASTNVSRGRPSAGRNPRRRRDGRTDRLWSAAMSFVTALAIQLTNGMAVAFVLAGLVAAPVHGATCSAEAVPKPRPWSSSTRRKGAAAARRPTSGCLPRSPRDGAAGAGIALAFHVDYWDRLGWKDRFAAPSYTERQYEECVRIARASSIRRRFWCRGGISRNGRTGAARPALAAALARSRRAPR